MPSLKSPHARQRARNAARAWRWRRHCIRFYRQFVDRGGLCFDVGANRGDRAALLLAIPARVVAIEPQSVCHELLEARFADWKGFTLVRAAATVACVGRLLELGDYEFNYSLNESLVLASQGWMSAYQLHDALAVLRSDTVTFGDVYARLVRDGVTRRRAARARATARFRISNDSK